MKPTTFLTIVSLKYPRSTFFIYLAIFIASCILAAGSQVETDARKLIGAEHPVKTVNWQIKEEFGIGDTLTVALFYKGNSTENIASKLVLASRSLLHDLSTIQGADIHRSVSISQLEPSKNSHYSTSATSLFAKQFVRGFLVGKNGRSTSILLALLPDSNRGQVIEKVARLIEKFNLANHNFEAVATGSDVVEAALTGQILTALATSIPLVALCVFSALWLILGNPLAALGTLASALISLGLTAGIMAAAGIPIYLTTSIAPVILITVAICDELHLLKLINRLPQRQLPLNEKIIAAVKTLWRPMTLTSLTTAAALFTFVFSDVTSIRFFGLFTALGICIAFIASITFAPAIWSLCPITAKVNNRGGVERFAAMLLTVSIPRSMKIAIGLSLLIVSGLSLSVFPTDDSWDRNFPASSTIRNDFQKTQDQFFSTSTIYIRLKSDGNYWLQEHNISKLQSFEDLITQNANAKSISVASVSTFLRPYWDGPAYKKAFYGPAELRTTTGYHLEKSLITADGSTVLISVMLEAASYQTVNAIRQLVKDNANEFFQNAVKVDFGGHLALSHAIVEELTKTQKLTFFVSIMFAATCLLIATKKPELALLTIAAPVISFTFTLAFMAIMGWPLSISSSMFIAILIGIGVDYAVHLQLSPATQFRQTNAAASVIIDALVVGFGLASLVFLDNPALAKLGAISAIMFPLTAITAIVFTQPRKALCNNRKTA